MLVNIEEAKAHLSKVINRVLKGDEIIIARYGKPLVRLVPYIKEGTSRKGGQFKGLMKITEDMDDPLTKNILKQFYGDD